MNTTTTKIAGEAMTDEQIAHLWDCSEREGETILDGYAREIRFARALLASKPAIIGASDRTEIFSSNLQRTREQWEKCDPEAMSKMSQAAVFHALNDAKRDVLMMHALLAAPQQPAQSAEQDERAEDAREALTEIREALEGIRRYGLDTLSGRADGPDDRDWQRAGVNEMTKRARLAIERIDRAASTQSTAPQPAQTQVALTDEQIKQVFMDTVGQGGSYQDFGRALLAAQPADGGKS
jgi:hypothetical protein